MKRTHACLLAAAALLTPAVASAQGSTDIACTAIPRSFDAPSAYIRVNDFCANLSPLIVLDRVTGLYGLQVSEFTLGIGQIVSLDVTFKQDPFISFATATTNFGAAPVTYAFLFATNVVPAFYSSASSTAGVSVTRGQGATASVSQDGSQPYLQVSGSNGASLFPLGVDLSGDPCTAGAATQTCSFPAPSGGPATNSFSPMFLDNLEVLLTFTQSGQGSQVGWTGRADIFEDGQTTVPEPATVVLTLAGLATLGVASVRRRRAR